MEKVVKLGLIQMSCGEDVEKNYEKALEHARQAASQGAQADLFGRVVAQAAADREEIVVCSIDLASVSEMRDGWSFPFRDRRVDSYGGLTKRFLDARD